ncbi:MAG TPA: hypothetical protein VGH98_11105 [Gemmatimonadaceae bacterium]
MAERAQLISQEAGTMIAAAMKDVISAAAGLAGFAVESARDLVQYMVRRGQMTQDEADKLIREAEQAHGRRSGRTSASKAPSGAHTQAAASAPAAERSPKSEPPREPARRESTKAGAAKRLSGATSAKSAKKEPAKRESAAKKPNSKSAKKRR